jgi:hypothetical protein
MELFKVFVILIVFTCQILAKPPINNVESSKTLDSEEKSAFEEIEIELSQENEEHELEFPDPKIMDLEAMEKEVAKDEEVKIKIRKKKNLEMPGIEPGAFHMQSERATTALHPLSCEKR